LPSDKSGTAIGAELATLNSGLTYVSLPANATLPEQPQEIAASVRPVTLSAALVAEIKAASPQVQLINTRVRDKIRATYDLADELKLARIAIGALQKTYTPTPEEVQDITDYQVAVEAARDWGRAEKGKLGLG